MKSTHLLFGAFFAVKLGICLRFLTQAYPPGGVRAIFIHVCCRTEVRPNVALSCDDTRFFFFLQNGVSPPVSWCEIGFRFLRQEKRAQRLSFWVWRPPSGVGVFHAKGWWPNPRKFVFLGFRKEESGMSREFCRDVPDPWGCSKSLCKRSLCAFFVPHFCPTPYPNSILWFLFRKSEPPLLQCFNL